MVSTIELAIIIDKVDHRVDVMLSKKLEDELPSLKKISSVGAFMGDGNQDVWERVWSMF